MSLHRLLLCTSAVVVLTTVTSTSARGSDWTKENQVSFELTRFGESLPAGGIYTDIYYTGELNMFAGDNENQLAVKVKLVQVTPRANTMRQPEIAERGTLRCRFYEKSPAPLGWDERQTILISAGDQDRIEVGDGDLIRIEVPDHASFVEISLRVDKFPDNDVAVFVVSRPYRDAAVQRVRSQAAREKEKQAVQEGKQIIEENCSKCNGTGVVVVPAQEETCPTCNGTGWVYRPFPAGSTGGGKKREKCAPPWGNCGGDGKIEKPAHNEACKGCQGTGKIRTIVDKPLAKPDRRRVETTMKLTEGKNTKTVSLQRLNLVEHSLKLERLSDQPLDALSKLPTDSPVLKVSLQRGDVGKADHVILLSQLQAADATLRRFTLADGDLHIEVSIELGSSVGQTTAAKEILLKATATGNAAVAQGASSGRAPSDGRSDTIATPSAEAELVARANHGDADAMNALGHMYQVGQGVSRNDDTAFQWFSKSAATGDAEAMVELGHLYADGRGTRRSDETALNWYLKAAGAGDTDGMVLAACLIEEGRGAAKDETRSFKLTQQASEGGNSKAMLKLGTKYMTGRGCDKDFASGFRWTLKAAEAGEVIAMVNVGMMYGRGDGTPSNEAESRRWIFRAADLGDADALYYAGQFYEQGIGVGQDSARARALFQRSADAGNEKAKKKLSAK